MYLQFYGLEELPFNISPDSKYLYLSPRHKEALAALEYGVKLRKGFIAITGEIGSGKTTVCRTFLKKMDPEKTRIAIILNSYLTEVELLQSVNQELGIPYESESRKVLIDTLNKFLFEQYAAGHNTIIIIDEAQNLMPPVLEQIRMLSNLETESDKILQIILIGQPELDSILSLPELEQLNQRIAVKYHLTPLSVDEINEYIQNRLRVAKAKVTITFTYEALRAIFKYTSGVPRKINLLCDRILLIGYVMGITKFDETIVEKAALEIKGGLQNRILPAKKEPLRFSSALDGDEPKRQIPAWILPVTLAFLFCIIVASAAVGVIIAKYKTPYIEEKPVVQKAKPKIKKESVQQKLQALSSDTKQTSEETNSSADSAAPAQPEEEKKPTAEELKEELRKQAALAAAQPTPTPGSDEPTPTPEPVVTETPIPKPVFKYKLQYDDAGIVRINDQELAYQACLLSWLNLWNIKVDLSGFQNYPLDLIKKFDLAVQNDKLGLKKFEGTWDLNRIIAFDSPVLCKLTADRAKLSKPGQNELTEWILLKKIEGRSCTIADPVYGIFILDRNKLSECVERIVVPFFDKNKFLEMLPNEKGDKVSLLQSTLKKQGYFKDVPDGAFGYKTKEAIKKLQTKSHLDTTGFVNEETVIVLNKFMTAGRPRLYSEFGAE